MNKNQLIKKYEDLVWYVRKRPEDRENGDCNQAMTVIEEKYPDELIKLTNDEENWHHGFNSGMLACLRLISGGRITNNTLNEFPMLDT